MGTLGVQEMLAHQPGLAKLKTATAPLCPARNTQMHFFSFPIFLFFLSNFCKHPRKLADICVGVRLFVYLEFFNSHQQRPTGALHHAVKVMELF